MFKNKEAPRPPSKHQQKQQLQQKEEETAGSSFDSEDLTLTES